jgi:hypothetical protein
MDLATLDGQNVLSHCHRCGRRMNPIEPVRANVHHHVLDWRARFLRKTEPFSLRRTCAGNAVITHGVSRACWASLWKQRYFRSESRPYSMWRDR